MKIRKICLFLAFCMLFISANVFTVSAEYVKLIYSKNNSFYAVGGNGTSMELITSTISQSSASYSGKASTTFRFPASGSYSSGRILQVSFSEILKVNHNYNLHLFLNSDLPSYTDFAVYLSAVGTNNDIVLFEYSGTTSDLTKWIEVDVSFFIDDSLSSTAGHEIIIEFFNTSQAMSYVRISETLELTDLDDNSNWFEDIISAIFQLDSDIDTYISDLESSLLAQLITLDSNIDSYFDALGGELVSAITNLDTHIDGYFQLLKNGIIENDIALSDKLHEYLDKYKPRFYEDLRWTHGSYFSGVLSKGSYAVCTDKFYVRPGSKYVLEYNEEDVSWTHLPLKIIYTIFDSEGNYLTDRSFTVQGSFEVYPNPGYYYSISVVFDDDMSYFQPYVINENLNSFIHFYADDGWLTAFGNYIVNEFDKIMNPGVYEDPGTDEYQDTKEEWEQIEGDLPSFDSDDMHEVDISNYSGGFGVIRYLFDRFLDASGLTVLMSFSLMFGLGVFLIGRKVGG